MTGIMLMETAVPKHVRLNKDLLVKDLLLFVRSVRMVLEKEQNLVMTVIQLKGMAVLSAILSLAFCALTPLRFVPPSVEMEFLEETKLVMIKNRLKTMDVQLIAK